MPELLLDDFPGAFGGFLVWIVACFDEQLPPIKLSLTHAAEADRAGARTTFEVLCITCSIFSMYVDDPGDLQSTMDIFSVLPDLARCCIAPGTWKIRFD